MWVAGGSRVSRYSFGYFGTKIVQRAVPARPQERTKDVGSQEQDSRAEIQGVRLVSGSRTVGGRYGDKNEDTEQ